MFFFLSNTKTLLCNLNKKCEKKHSIRVVTLRAKIIVFSSHPYTFICIQSALHKSEIKVTSERERERDCDSHLVSWFSFLCFCARHSVSREILDFFFSSTFEAHLSWEVSHSLCCCRRKRSERSTLHCWGAEWMAWMEKDFHISFKTKTIIPMILLFTFKK